MSETNKGEEVLILVYLKKEVWQQIVVSMTGEQ